MHSYLYKRKVHYKYGLQARPAGSAATATDIRYAPPEHSPLPLGTAPESPQSISFHQY